MLLARTLLSSTRGDLATLTSRGQGRSARADPGGDFRWTADDPPGGGALLAWSPHQLCHFHYLDEAAEPIFEADRHAKTELKKLVRGVRPLERSLEGGEDEQTEAMRSYCLAVLSALTDDGYPPLCASGLKLHDRLTQIADSAFAGRGKKGGLPPSLRELHHLLARALKKTEAVWPDLEQAYALVHQAAHVLANHENEKGQAVRERYKEVLNTMREQQASLGPLGKAIDTFVKVTESYWPGLFHCYDVADLPRTNNELEQCFGSVRYGERRASGRRGAMVALVVRGPVRVLTALALRRQCFLPQALVLQDFEAWYTLREQLTFRREARRKQLRFRKDPAAYLAALEEILLKTGLPF